MSDTGMTIEQSVIRKIQSQETSVVIEDTVNQAKYIIAILDSCLGRWFLLQKKTIPVPKISAAGQQPFIRLVDEILEAKATNPEADTEPLEWAIDDLVYELYGLTKEENTAVERSLGLIHQTDEEEDAAIGRAIDAAKAEDPGSFVKEEVIMSTLRDLDGD